MTLTLTELGTVRSPGGTQTTQVVSLRPELRSICLSRCGEGEAERGERPPFPKSLC
jgi:hypothetical protein